MKRKIIRKIIIWTGGTMLFLVLVLALHIYLVTRPKAPDANTRIMARIDIRQKIDDRDKEKITTWLYQQRGVDHVLVNAQTRIAVFTYFPIKTSAEEIVQHFKSSLPYISVRVVPTAAELQSGCPVMAQSFTAKVYQVIKQIF